MIRTGASELYTQMSDEYLVKVARTSDHLEALRALAIRSAMVIPMRIRSRTVGVMTFGTSVSGRQLTEDDVALAEQLAARAAIAVENSRLHTTLRRVSETLQQSLLPREPPEVPGWDIAALYRPAGEGQRVEVGGDFYEVFETEAAALAVIGDVTGHGVTATTTTSLLRHGARFARSRAISGRHPPPPRRGAPPERCEHAGHRSVRTHNPRSARVELGRAPTRSASRHHRHGARDHHRGSAARRLRRRPLD